MVTEWPNPPDADVILRASGGKEFHAHKLVLSLASPVFRDMFSVPQPPPPEPSQLPIIDVNDPPEALEAFLRFIYPTRNPLIDNVETLASLIRLVDKYDSKDVLDVHGPYPPPTYTDFSPIEMYLTLCACGREEQAEAAARCVPFASLKTLDSNPLLQLITTTQYQQLLSFLTARDQRMREIVGRHQAKIDGRFPTQCRDLVHSLYSGTIASTIQAAFEMDPCVRVGEALGLVASAPHTSPQCSDDCKYSVGGVRRYAEELLEELVGMAQDLSWEDPHMEHSIICC